MIEGEGRAVQEVPVKPTPSDGPRISSSAYYRDPPRTIDWLCRAFGFEVRIKVDGECGRIEHSELTFGDGLIMVYVDDVDAHRARTRFTERAWERETERP